MNRLDEIEARLQAATPEPWEWEKGTDGSGDPVRDLFAVGEGYGYSVIEGAYFVHEYDQTNDANAALIAHAPADLAALLRVARAGEKRREARTAFRAWHTTGGDVTRDSMMTGNALALAAEAAADEEDAALAALESEAPR